VKPIPVGVSSRHLHLTREHLNILFGPGYELKRDFNLTQLGQYAAKEKVTLIGPKGSLEGVRILGPMRDQTQIEISKTDAYRLGLDPPVRDSGILGGSPGITIVGPVGRETIKEGVILALRHVHMNPQDAKEFGVVDKEIVKIEVKGDRALIFDEVIVRVSDKYVLDFHVDTDEANAAGLKTGDSVWLIKKEKPQPPPSPRRICKKFINEEDVKGALKRGDRILVAKGTIITPLALDLGKKLGILDYLK